MAITNAVSSNAANTATSTVTLPSSVAAGDLIVAIIGGDSGAAAFTWPSPWVEIKDLAGVGFVFGAAYLIASGGETSVSVTHTSERTNQIAFRFPAAEWHGTTPPEINTTPTSGTNNQPNPPAFGPSWGAEATHWIAVAVADDSAPPGPITAYPASYTSNNVTANTATSAAFLAAAIRESFVSASENPGVFTMTGSEDWDAYTIAVRPAASSGALIAGIIAGQSTLAGDLTANPAALIAGIIAGQSTLSGDLTPGTPTGAALLGVIGGISTLSADLTPAPAAQLAGIIAAQSGMSGKLFDPTDVVLPTLSAIGNCFIELWAPTPPLARWDSAVWDSATWSDEMWQDITPQSQNVRFGWGADDASQGILSQVAANAWTVATYDPDRLLDPANADSPYHPALRPGSHVQVRYDDGTNNVVLKEGAIDSISYSIDEQRGQIRVTDRVSTLAGARLPAGLTGVPTTLYAATQFLLAAAGLDTVIWVEPTPVPDPPIGAAIAEETSVWDWLNTIALDCMHGVYLVANDIATTVNGKSGIRSVIKFVDFTATPVDNGLEIGGGGVPVEDIQPVASREGVFSQVTTFDDGAPTTPLTVTNDEAVTLFGIVPYKRDRPVPSGIALGTTILQDRAGASLQYHLGTLRPVTTAQLLGIFSAGMLEQVQITATTRDNGQDPLDVPIDVQALLLGMSFEANTATGWSANAVAYLTAIQWT